MSDVRSDPSSTFYFMCANSAGSPEPSLVAYVISTIISWAGSFHFGLSCFGNSQIMSYWEYDWKTVYQLWPCTEWLLCRRMFSISNERHKLLLASKEKLSVKPRGKGGRIKKKTSSPKGNDRSPESNVPRSDLISENIYMGHGKQRPEIELVQAFMPVLVTSNFDDFDDLIKNKWASMETPSSHYRSMGNCLDLKGS